MSAIRHLWQNHRLVLVIFVAASAVTVFFLVRLTVFSIYWSDPTHRNLTPEPWMTPGYIAHSWGLAPQTLADHLGISPGTRPSLADIARSRDVPVADILDQVSTFLAETPPK